MDYFNAAQQRVAADTGLLQKKTTMTVPAGSSNAALPSDLVAIDGLFNGTWALTLIPTIEYMRLASGTPIIVSESSIGQFFCVIGRTLYVWPSVAVVNSTLTIFYTYRPPVMTSDSAFVFTGPAKRLIERLASAMILWDDGQPELAQAELSNYVKDAGRLAHRNRGMEGGGGQLQLAGRRRAPG